MAGKRNESGGGVGCFLILLVLAVLGLIANFRQSIARSTGEAWSWVILIAIGVAVVAVLAALIAAGRAHGRTIRAREYEAAKAADAAARQAEWEWQRAAAEHRLRQDQAHRAMLEAARQAEIQRRLSSPQWANPYGYATPRRPLSRADRRVIFDRDGGRCRQCGETFDLQYDHIVPLAVGGSNELSNLQLLCGLCNQRKGGRLTPGHG